MRISDWSSDVCSSDLSGRRARERSFSDTLGQVAQGGSDHGFGNHKRIRRVARAEIAVAAERHANIARLIDEVEGMPGEVVCLLPRTSEVQQEEVFEGRINRLLRQP